MKLHLLRGRARLVAAAAALALAVSAGCSGSSQKPTLGGKEPIDAVVAAMQKAASGRTKGTTTGAGGTALAPLDGVFNGGLTGEGDFHAVFAASNGTKLPTELRWVNNTLYFSRSTASAPATDSLRFLTRPVTSKPWDSATLQAYGLGALVRAIPAGFSPVALVEQLQGQHVALTVHSGESVGSTKATRMTTATPVFVGVWQNATVNFWVDKNDRVIRVQISGPGGGTQYDVSDYGAKVVVTPPPRVDLQTKNETVANTPSGPFVTAKSGTSNGVNWTLQQAPGTNGTQCWRFLATPPLPQVGLQHPSDPACFTPPPATSDDPSNLVAFVVDGNGTGSYDALGVLLPPGVKQLTLGFVGGTTVPLPPDRIVVWTGPTNPVKGYLGVTLADGTHMDCGAGAVGSVGDLTDPRVTQNLGVAPWGCIPPT